MSSPVPIRSVARPHLELPPPFRVVRLREVGDAFAHAQSVASTEGAGTLVWVGRFDFAEVALVLEPEEPLGSARRVFFAGMTALGDALTSLAPPEKPIEFDYPDGVRIDGGLVGGARLAWPEKAAEDEVPDWLVFGAAIRIVAMGEREPGMHPLSSALEEEGFDGSEAERLIELFARYFMLHLDAWHEHGFDEIARTYARRLRDRTRRLDAEGNLLVAGDAPGEQGASFVEVLSRAAWYDPETKAPRV